MRQFNVEIFSQDFLRVSCLSMVLSSCAGPGTGFVAGDFCFFSPTAFAPPCGRANYGNGFFSLITQGQRFQLGTPSFFFFPASLTRRSDVHSDFFDIPLLVPFEVESEPFPCFCHLSPFPPLVFGVSSLPFTFSSLSP